MKFINDQYEKYLQEEVNINRKKRIPDTRVHCCLYFIPATGHSYVPAAPQPAVGARVPPPLAACCCRPPHCWVQGGRVGDCGQKLLNGLHAGVGRKCQPCRKRRPAWVSPVGQQSSQGGTLLGEQAPEQGPCMRPG